MTAPGPLIESPRSRSRDFSSLQSAPAGIHSGLGENYGEAGGNASAKHVALGTVRYTLTMNSFVRDGVACYCCVQLAWVGLYSLDVSTHRVQTSPNYRDRVLHVGMPLIPSIGEPNLDSTGVSSIVAGYAYPSITWSVVPQF